MAKSDAYQEALKRIKEAAARGAKELKLVGLGLTDLPPEIGSLTALQVLDLEGNQLTTLPPQIGSLTALQTLDLESNQLNALPLEIGLLTALRDLDLYNNNLTTIPLELGFLSALDSLHLASNRLPAVPPEIGSLIALKTLYLHTNRLTTLPREIGSLTALQRLVLNGNQLTTLPPEIGSLNALQVLYLSDNQITTLPPEIGSLTALQSLDLTKNQLEALPPEIRKLRLLKAIYLHGNNKLELSPEVLGPRVDAVGTRANPKSILAFYFQREKEKDSVPGVSRTLNEGKILVVGEPGAGKTALIHWLTKNRPLKNPQWTKGIKIADWKVPPLEEDETEIDVHIWDFGGQEIMQATHQFFLTERTLYLLVIDSRNNEEQSKIRYWLTKIRAFGKDSPVIVVLNKRDAGESEPDESRLRIDFSGNISESFFRTVCNCGENKHKKKTLDKWPKKCRCGEGIDALRVAIIAHVQKLENVRQSVPASYLKTKSLLEAQAGKKKYLSQVDYKNLCKKQKLGTDDRDALLSYLKQLGTLFHYDSPGSYGPLPDTYVLDPRWVTDGVYTILADLDLKKRGGEVTPADLGAIFKGSKRYTKRCQEFILAMMEADLFELAFRVPDPPSSKPGLRLIPELFLPSEPSHGITTDKSLNLEYHYEYLPTGLIPRFIVRMHNAISEKTYWKNGVVLNLDGRRVLVRGSRGENKLFVSVEGREPSGRRALVVVRENLAAIHASMRHLVFQEMIVAPDNPKVMEPYKHLENLERSHGLSYRFDPRGATRQYEVAEFLVGLERKSNREEASMNEGTVVAPSPLGSVFISYAHEDEDHSRKVRQMADRLRDEGVDAWIDAYLPEMGPPEGWPTWMEKQIHTASIVLMVCGPKYLRRCEKKEAVGVGLGATWEAHIIYQNIYKASTINSKYRAVLVDERHRDCIPVPLQPFSHFKYYEPSGYDTLYRALTGQQRIVAPPLGKPRSMPRG